VQRYNLSEVVLRLCPRDFYAFVANQAAWIDTEIPPRKCFKNVIYLEQGGGRYRGTKAAFGGQLMCKRCTLIGVEQVNKRVEASLRNCRNYSAEEISIAVTVLLLSEGSTITKLK
jgi:hypothetical protein